MPKRGRGRAADDSDGDYSDDMIMHAPRSTGGAPPAAQPPAMKIHSEIDDARMIIGAWWRYAIRGDTRAERQCPLHQQILNCIYMDAQQKKETDVQQAFERLIHGPVLQFDSNQGGIIGGECCCKGAASARMDLAAMRRHAEKQAEVHGGTQGKFHDALGAFLREKLGHERTLTQEHAAAAAPQSAPMEAARECSWPPMVLLATEPSFFPLINSKNQAKKYLNKVSEATDYLPVYSYSKERERDNSFKGQIVLVFRGTTNAHQDKLFSLAQELLDECNAPDQKLITSAKFVDRKTFDALPKSTRDDVEKKLRSSENAVRSLDWRQIIVEKGRIAEAHKQQEEQMRELRQEHARLIQEQEQMREKMQQLEQRHEQRLREQEDAQEKERERLKEVDLLTEAMDVLGVSQQAKDMEIDNASIENARIKKELEELQERLQRSEGAANEALEAQRAEHETALKKTEATRARLLAERQGLQQQSADYKKKEEELEKANRANRLLQAQHEKEEKDYERQKEALQAENERNAVAKADAEKQAKQLQSDLKMAEDLWSQLNYSNDELQRPETMLDELMKHTEVLRDALEKRKHKRFEWRTFGEVHLPEVMKYVGNRLSPEEIFIDVADWGAAITGAERATAEEALRFPRLDKDEAFVKAGGKYAYVREKESRIDYPPIYVGDRVVQRPSTILRPLLYNALTSAFGKQAGKKLLEYLMGKANELIVMGKKHSGYGVVKVGWDREANREMTPAQKLAFLLNHAKLEGTPSDSSAFRSNAAAEVPGFEHRNYKRDEEKDLYGWRSSI